MASNKLITPKPTLLCDLAYKYGTDKCPQIKHHYTPFYYQLLNPNRNTIKKVLEIGIGRYKGMDKKDIIFDPNLNRYYHKGASLYMWRDFFPNAQIYGADIVPDALIEDHRIKSYLLDERKKEDINNLIKEIGGDIDLVIDDASHHVDDQIYLAKTILPLLQQEVIFIIEDVNHSRHIRRALGDQYNYLVPDIPRKWHGGMLLVITKKI